MNYDELKNQYDSLNGMYDLLEEQYLEKQIPDEVRVQFDTIKDRIDFIQSKLGRIEDSDDGKTITIRGNVKLSATDFVEVRNSFGDVSNEAFDLAFREAKETEERLSKLRL